MKSLGPTWASASDSFTRIWLVTESVFERFFDCSRSRSSMFWKSLLPPKLS